MPATTKPAPPTDRERCVSCGYDVRGLEFVGDMALCPECGQGIDRTVLAGVPRLRRPFVVGLVLPLVLFGLYSWTPRYREFLDRWVELKVLLHVVVAFGAAPVAFVVRNRGRWRVLPRGRRGLVVEGVVFWLICGAVMVGLAVNWTYVWEWLGW